MCSAGDLVFPGDILSNLNQSEKSGKTVIGPGIATESGEIIVTKPGILRHKEPNFYWIDCHQKRV